MLVIQQVVVAAEDRHVEYPADMLDDLRQRFLVQGLHSSFDWAYRLRQFARRVASNTTGMGLGSEECVPTSCPHASSQCFKEDQEPREAFIYSGQSFTPLYRILTILSSSQLYCACVQAKTYWPPRYHTISVTLQVHTVRVNTVRQQKLRH